MLGAPNKSELTFKKVGFSLELNLLQKLDDYAERKFKGNRSAAANYLLGALLKSYFSVLGVFCGLAQTDQPFSIV
ncbi:MAG: ribbon-helix-helix domain-containing protein [Candidatus Bathyarchaeota archaeon]|nr:ribbon-helix-helix domain-containing protein [Candidatus Bathyarchaeota archaeon]